MPPNGSATSRKRGISQQATLTNGPSPTCAPTISGVTTNAISSLALAAGLTPSDLPGGLIRDLFGRAPAPVSRSRRSASAGAAQLGDRFWFVAATNVAQLREQPSAGQQPQHEQDTRARPSYARRNYEWRRGSDGKKRRVDASIDLLAHGVPDKMGKLRAFGNAVTPSLAQAFIEASAEALGLSI